MQPWNELLAFVGTCLFMISKWAPLSDGLLPFLPIEFKVEVTTHKTSDDNPHIPNDI